jgi:hypothetical protein
MRSYGNHPEREDGKDFRESRRYYFGKRVFRLLLTSPCSCVPIILVV